MNNRIIFAFYISIVTAIGLSIINLDSNIRVGSSVNEIQKIITEDKIFKPIILTDSTFEESIKKGIVLVDFWATWCHPCVSMAPDINFVADKYYGKVMVAKLDIDKNHNTTKKYYVRSFPTLILFKDGKIKERVIGQQSKKDIEKLINKYL